MAIKFDAAGLQAGEALRRARIYLGARTFAPGAGGISRVARLMAKVLAQQHADAPTPMRAVAVEDAVPNRFGSLPVAVKDRSIWRFVADIQRAQLSYTHFLYDELSMARAHTALPLRRPSLSFFHGIEVWEQGLASRVRCARKVDMLVANSAYTRARAERVHGGFGRARVCWLGTEDDAPARSAPQFTGPPTVLMVGRLHAGRDKGHRALIRAWPRLCAKIPSARLVIVGQGNDAAALKQEAAACGVAQRIAFLGFLPDEQLSAIWEQAWVFAMPSRGEGFGLVYIEAMRHGLPVIGSVHDAAPEVNVDGETGYNVDLHRPNQLTDRLWQLLTDPDRCRTLGTQGRKRWQRHFTYSAFCRRFCAILDEFLAMQ